MVVSPMSVASSTSFSQIPGSSVSVTNGRSYAINALLIITTGATPNNGGFAVKVHGTASVSQFQATAVVYQYKADPPTSIIPALSMVDNDVTYNVAFPASNGPYPGFAGGCSLVLQLTGTFTATSDGIMWMEFAQQTSATSASVANVGSYMQLISQTI
jgi:hypothetical protein